MPDRRELDNVLSDQVNGFADLRIRCLFGELRINNPEIVSDDMPLLDVQAQNRQLILQERIERVEFEGSKSFAAKIHILKIILDRLCLNVWPLAQSMLIGCFQGRFERGQNVLMRIP